MELLHISSRVFVTVIFLQSLRVDNLSDLNAIGVSIGLENDSVKPTIKFDKNGFALTSVYGKSSSMVGRDQFVIKFRIDPNTVQGLNETLILNVTINVRNNSNVKLNDVIKNKAVFVYDKFDLFPGDPELKYAQMMLNQVIPRKQSYYDDAGINYKMIEENGIFNNETMTAIKTFKNNFDMEGISGIGNYNDTNGSGDDWSDTFKGLMKDYGYNSYFSVPFLHKIIDQALLVGKFDRPADFLINKTPGSANDTGLYELYTYVVKPFIDGMIAEADRYTGSAPTDNWSSRPVTVETRSKNSFTGKIENKKVFINFGPIGTKYPHGPGVSYSYAGYNTIQEFNDKVTKCPAPDSIEKTYSGNADKQSCAIGSTGRYAGLTQNEYSLGGSMYKAENWAGIDCTGFLTKLVTKSVRDMLPKKLDVKAMVVDYHGPSVADLVNNLAESTYYSIHNNDDETKFLTKGDIALFLIPKKIHHAALFYSDRISGSTLKGKKYRIVHAYGTDKYKGGFSRKVLETGDDISKNEDVTVFGRYKIWK
jgi:hypothetical protein